MNRLVMTEDAAETAYVFLLFAKPEGVSNEEYRNTRLWFLDGLCRAAKVNNPQLQNIIGVATERPQTAHGSSEDFCYLDSNLWTQELEKKTTEEMEKFRWFTDTTYSNSSQSDAEYPIDPRFARGAMTHVKNPRNKRCPCGSGRKYKKCCAP